MNQAEKLTSQIQKLTPEFQKEVSDFVEFLQLKSQKKSSQTNTSWWSDFSLSSAMSGLENDDNGYQLTNLKERWR